MTREQEKAWIRGNRAAWVMLLSEAVRMLDYENSDDLSRSEIMRARLIIERERALRSLHDLSIELGCDDWTDDLAMSDIIEKYIARSIGGRDAE